MRTENLKCDAEGCGNAEVIIDESEEQELSQWFQFRLCTGRIIERTGKFRPGSRTAERQDFDLCPACARKFMLAFGLAPREPVSGHDFVFGMRKP